MHPRAIETRYKGYRFRSRLEARWAVFFDALGLRWEYEPEGFELPGGVRYLPDFRLHDIGPKTLTGRRRPVFAEVKPTKEADDGKAAAFSTLWLDPVAHPKTGEVLALQPAVLLLDGAPDALFYDAYVGGKLLVELCFYSRGKGQVSLSRGATPGDRDASLFSTEAVTEALERSRGIRFVRNEQW